MKDEHITHPETTAATSKPLLWIDGADIGFIKDGIKSSASLFTSQVLPCMVPLFDRPAMTLDVQPQPVAAELGGSSTPAKAVPADEGEKK